jgi:hypothetical protein
VCKGTTDAAAQLQAAKGLAALLSHVQQHHKATCRRAEVRWALAAASAVAHCVIVPHHLILTAELHCL